MPIATTVLLILVALVQLVAAAAARARAVPLLMFGSAGLLLLLASTTGAVLPALLGGVLACAAPLAWSHGQGIFHLHHHVVRLAAVGAVVGCFA